MFGQEIRLRTRAECERARERVVNWVKAEMLDANRGNTIINGIKAVLTSKTSTEEMELKVTDRALIAHIQEIGLVSRG